MNRQTSIHHGRHFPSEIIAQAVYLYHRFSLSLRDVAELLAMRGISVSYETIRVQCAHFGPRYTKRMRNRRGDTIDILVQNHRGKRAAKRFFRKLLRGEGRIPNRIVTDNLKSYAAAKREMMPDVPHCQDRYANNRRERSHEPTREQKRQVRGFKSSGSAQRFLAVHARVPNSFRLGLHLLRAQNYRILRDRALVDWREATAG